MFISDFWFDWFSSSFWCGKKKKKQRIKFKWFRLHYCLMYFLCLYYSIQEILKKKFLCRWVLERGHVFVSIYNLQMILKIFWVKIIAQNRQISNCFIVSWNLIVYWTMEKKTFSNNSIESENVSSNNQNLFNETN